MSDSDAWVVDRGLLVLRDQINAAAPNRDKSSDGTIGDAAHAARDSDHNPESPPPAGNPDNQVDALDVTHDPAHGADMAIVSESIRASHDRRVRYIIFARRIVYPDTRNGYEPWQWQPYSGDDPHTNHMHVSVNDVHHDETQPWQIGIDMPTADEIAKAVWQYKVREYRDENDNAVREARPMQDLVAATHAAADEVRDRKPAAADVAIVKAALTDPEVTAALRALVRAELDATSLAGRPPATGS